MAEADKPDSSAGKAKSTMSFLDEDISTDFLSSWKSMSAKGGDDMDFNFEPVTKGKKNKAFDFGMDMDFSLDDAFGKMPSFKLDMPDIDFSSSPKKSLKSMEKKSEDESAKGSRKSQNDGFTFDFDFDGNGNGNEMGDKRTTVVADAVPGSGQAKKDGLNLLDCGKTSIDVKSGDIDRQEIVENKATMVADPVLSSGQTKEEGLHLLDKKTSIDVKHGDDSRCEESGERLHDNSSSCRQDSNELTKQDVAVGKRETNDDTSKDADNIENGRMPNKNDVGFVPPDEQAEKNQLHLLHNRKMTIESKPSRDKEISFAEAFGKMPSFKVNMPHIDFYSSSKKYSKLKGNLSDLESAKGTRQEENNKLPPPTHVTKKMSAAPITEGVIGVAEIQGDDNVITSVCSLSNISETVNLEVTSNAELEISGREESPAPSDSELTHAKPMSMISQVSEVKSAATKLPMVDRSNNNPASLGAAGSGNNPCSEQGGQKLEESPSSCANGFLKQELSVEKREKSADVSKDTDCNGNEQSRTNVAVHPVPSDGQVHNKKISSDDKAFGIRLPSLGGPKETSYSGNHGNVKQAKSSKLSTVQISNVGQLNRLPSARVDKIMPSLSSSRISRNITSIKKSSSLTLHDPNSTGTQDKSPRLKVKTKMDSPANVQKLSPLLPSLKRKPAEDADFRSFKRPSPSESKCRKSEVPAKGVESEVQTQGSLTEEPKNISTENTSPKFDFHLEANMENLGFTLMEEGNVNVEKAEACAKELDDICSMLKKKHDEAKELLVRVLVTNNNLLMLNHPICEEKIREVQRFASRLMSRGQVAGV